MQMQRPAIWASRGGLRLLDFGLPSARAKYTPYLLLLPGMLLVLVFVAYPLLDAAWLSLQRQGQGAESVFAGLDNYYRLIADPALRTVVTATLVFVSIGVPVSLVLGFGLALLIWQAKVRARGVFQILFVLPIVVTPAVVGLMWKWILSPTFGILNFSLQAVGLPAPLWFNSPALAVGTVIAVDVWQYTPFIFLTLLAGLRSLPDEPFEAARIDGASAIQMLRYITIPLLRPVLVVVLAFRVFIALRAFDVIYTLTAGGPGRATQVLNLYIYQQGVSFSDPYYASALAILLFVLSVPAMIGFVRASTT
jgi:multiple sugar transport system permease protein